MKSEARSQKPEPRRQKLSSVFWPLASGIWLLVLNGCVTAPKSVPSPPPNLSPPGAPAPAPEKKPPAPPPVPPPAPTSVAPPPVSTPPPPKGEFVIAIDSDPSGATIVVNGIPIGKAPLQLKVKTTLQGFFRDYLTVKARFLATNEAETSITVEEDCTPRDKIPREIIFTPLGAQRWQQGQAGNGK
jgi:hypothetical protein